MIYNPGIVRDDPPNCRNGSVYAAETAPGGKSNLVFATSHPGTWTRAIDVYVPGSEALFIVFGDGGATGAYSGRDLFTTLDSLERPTKLALVRSGCHGQAARSR